MSLLGIFDPIVRAHFEKQYANSGSSGGATTAVYRKDQTYLNIGDEENPMLKISDLTPTANELRNGIIAADGGMMVMDVATSEEGAVGIQDGIRTIAMILSADVAGLLLGDPALAGFYFMYDTPHCDFWFCWESSR